jgi:hypothetical protein
VPPSSDDVDAIYFGAVQIWILNTLVPPRRERLAEGATVVRKCHSTNAKASNTGSRPIIYYGRVLSFVRVDSVGVDGDLEISFSCYRYSVLLPYMAHGVVKRWLM